MQGAHPDRFVPPYSKRGASPLLGNEGSQNKVVQAYISQYQSGSQKHLLSFFLVPISHHED